MSKRPLNKLIAFGAVCCAAGLWLAPAVAQINECGTTSTLGSDGGGASPGCTGGCPTKGTCDCPDTRDLWDTAASPVTVRVIIHVFDTRVDQDDIDAQRLAIIADYAAENINLMVETEKILGSGYEVLYDNGDVVNMKNDYAVTPDQKLNVYVSDFDQNLLFRGKGTFPWDSDALTAQGGIIIDGDAFGANKTTLTHEIGHNLGLWHTHHGQSFGELQFGHGACGQFPTICTCVCYEPVSRTEMCGGELCCDVTGDFSCDTDATPTNFDCAAPGGTEACGDRLSYSVTDFRNFLSYAVDETVPPCRDHFKDDQAARMQCWLCDGLIGWTGDPTGGCCLPDGSCQITTQTCCTNGGGSWEGAYSTCSTGACCKSDYTCEDDVSQACCTAGDGSFLGAQTTCQLQTSVCCLQPLGQCRMMTQDCCAAAGGLYHPGQTCPYPCESGKSSSRREVRLIPCVRWPIESSRQVRRLGPSDDTPVPHA